MLTFVFGTLFFTWFGTSEAGVHFSWSPGESKTRAVPPCTVLVWVEPGASLESRLLEDALAARLMASGFKVIGQLKAEKSGKEFQNKQRAKAGKGKDLQNTLPPDVLDLARGSGAELILVASVLATQSQMNLYDSSSGQVREVQTILRIQIASISLVASSSGNVLAAGIAEYESGELPSKVASDLVSRIKLR